jgi:hypothetical protein
LGKIEKEVVVAKDTSHLQTKKKKKTEGMATFDLGTSMLDTPAEEVLVKFAEKQLEKEERNY